MQIGVVFSQADSGTDAGAIRQWAVDAEAAGFAHLLAYDHILGASAQRLGPGPFGSFPNAPYTNEHTFHEILTLFAHLAAVTTRLRFVTSVLITPQRQTALVAKQLATLDLLSGQRIDVAVGVGWNPAEYQGLGTDFEHRTAMLEEQIEVLRALWTQPLVEYHGRFHHLDAVGINPLPVAPLPLIIGSGGADAVLRRVVRCADGWMPLLIAGLDRIDLTTAVRRLRQLALDAGRDPMSIPIHGRVYLGPGWQQALEDAKAMGFASCSVGFNRLAEPGRTHRHQLQSVVNVKAEIDRIVG